MSVAALINARKFFVRKFEPNPEVLHALSDVLRLPENGTDIH